MALLDSGLAYLESPPSVLSLSLSESSDRNGSDSGGLFRPSVARREIVEEPTCLEDSGDDAELDG